MLFIKILYLFPNNFYKTKTFFLFLSQKSILYNVPNVIKLMIFSIFEQC